MSLAMIPSRTAGTQIRAVRGEGFQLGGKMDIHLSPGGECRIGEKIRVYIMGLECTA